MESGEQMDSFASTWHTANHVDNADDQYDDDNHQQEHSTSQRIILTMVINKYQYDDGHQLQQATPRQPCW